jgi:4-hydroxy-2-oxoheptanedioate aldolase
MPLLDPLLFQPLLDLGIDTVIVPNIRTADQALAAVRAVDGSTDAICLLLQIDSAQALANLDAICAVAGVDGLFMAPVDLAADLGYPAQLTHPAVVEHAMAGLRRIRAAGKAAGILAPEAQAQTYLDAGASMVCLGSADDSDAQDERWVQREAARA